MESKKHQDSSMHYVNELCKKFTKIESMHITRIQNEFTDALVTFSSLIQHHDKSYIEPIEVEIRDPYAYCFHVDEETDSMPQFHGIKRFIEIRKYPESATTGQKRELRILANHFFLNGKVLYRRTMDFGLSRCVDIAEATRL
ncbi:uncharacterized protein [Nicotiana sylvestris]